MIFNIKYLVFSIYLVITFDFHFTPNNPIKSYIYFFQNHYRAIISLFEKGYIHSTNYVTSIKTTLFGLIVLCNK